MNATDTKNLLNNMLLSRGVFPVGDVRYVCNATATASRATGVDAAANGKNPNYPLATIDYAIGLLTANNGDVIVVLPGHAETIADTTSLAFDKAGIKVIGFGEGTNRPTLTLSAVAASIIFSVANCVLDGFLILFTHDVTIGLDINIADNTVRNCEFRNKLTATAREAVTMIDIAGSAANACDRTLIEGCKFYAQTAGTTQAIELGEIADKVRIKGCEFWGDYGTACIHNPTGFVLTLLQVEDCTLQNTNSGSHSIELVSACTGALKRNFYHNAMTQQTCVDPGSCFSFECYQDDAVDTAGILTPIIT